MNRLNYPRPDFIQEKTTLLDGDWDFSFDDSTFDHTIKVPFCYQSKESGINEKTSHPIVWYRKEWTCNKKNGRFFLHFGACDYLTKAWVNGEVVGIHEGGFDSFSFEITDSVQEGKNNIVVKVCDWDASLQNRGKQTWEKKPFGCWYTPTTGIWQSVWIEETGPHPIEFCHFLPDLSKWQVTVNLKLYDTIDTQVSIDFLLSDLYLGKLIVEIKDGEGQGVFCFVDKDVALEDLVWSPSTPNLIDAIISCDSDKVFAYFGLRSIVVDGNAIILNRNKIYQKLILDQGFWPETLLTPPNIDALVTDIELAKKLGFNGARKHQKIEDPRYYYLADKMGFFVWGELPSCYRFSSFHLPQIIQEMSNFINRDFNHPSLITWVPINESWGVSSILENKQEQNFSKGITYLIKSLDPTRLVSSNDGWEMPDITDIIGIHDYTFTSKNKEKYENPLSLLVQGFVSQRMLFQKGSIYHGQPILLTEFGGIAFDDKKDSTWGYLDKVHSVKEFEDRLKDAVVELKKSNVAGFCYTQLTDVQQETNGLLTEKRTPKIPFELSHQIFA